MNINAIKIAALAAFLVLCSAALYIYRPNPNNLSRITVIGDSQTKIAPDTAVITFSVVTTGKQAVGAQQENARKSESVKTAVEAIAADATAEFKTSDYSVSPEQDYYSGKPPKILGYNVKNTVTISIDKLDRVGSIIDAATAAGANSVEGIQFVVGEASPAQGEALGLATKQAMAKAESIAKSLNGKIVRIVETREGGAPIEGPRNRVYENASSNSMIDFKPSVPTPVQAGSLNIRSQVVLVVDISI